MTGRLKLISDIFTYVPVYGLFTLLKITVDPGLVVNRPDIKMVSPALRPYVISTMEVSLIPVVTFSKFAIPLL